MRLSGARCSRATPTGAGRLDGGMTAKERLLAEVERLDEAAAAEVLELLASRRSLERFLDEAPVDDEPESEEERTAVAEAKEALARGETVDLGAARSELE